MLTSNGVPVKPATTAPMEGKRPGTPAQPANSTAAGTVPRVSVPLQTGPAATFQSSASGTAGMTARSGQNAPAPTPATVATPAGASASLPGAVGQLLGAGMERALSQAASFFQGNKRDTVDEKERDKRKRSDFVQEGLFGERKVEQAGKSNLGGGSQ